LEILCRCRCLIHTGVLLAIEDGACGVAEVWEFCLASWQAIPVARTPLTPVAWANLLDCWGLQRW